MAVLGAGLMGGSLAMALGRHPEVDVITVYDVSAQVREKAREILSCKVAGSPESAVRDADMVFIATPAGSVVDVFQSVQSSMKKSAIASDLASVKSRITSRIDALKPDGVTYVGGHPMTGSEQSGIEAARPDLFSDCYYILTPTDETDPSSLETLHRFLTKMGSRVITIDPESHDRAMAAVSHVPHLVAQLLMDMASREREHTKSLFKLAAGGFRDMTRIAASDPKLWLDVCQENSGYIAARLRELSVDVERLASAVESGDSRELATRFERARRERLELSRRGARDPGQMFEVRMAVPDEPGIISRITTATGAVGVNIEDIGIVHPLEGETGILTLRVKGEKQARLAADAASSLGFKASVRGV